MTNVLEHLENELKAWKQQLLSDENFYHKWYADEPNKATEKIEATKKVVAEYEQAIKILKNERNSVDEAPKLCKGEHEWHEIVGGRRCKNCDNWEIYPA